MEWEKTKSKALIIESGSLIEREDVLDWLKEKQKEYHITLLMGAGEQTNQAFLEAGYEIKFCPMGRVTDSFEQMQSCKRIARINEGIVRSLLTRKGIIAKILIPFDFSDEMVIPVNGDLAMFFKYLGYDKIFRLTTKNRVKAKRLLIKKVALAFASVAGENGIDMDLSKIEVVGF